VLTIWRNIIACITAFAGQSWHFLTPEGENLSVAVSGNLSASISSLLMEAAVNHCGIAMLPEREAQTALERGELVPVLTTLRPKSLAIYGIYQSVNISPPRCAYFLTNWPVTWRIHEGRLSSSAGCKPGREYLSKPCNNTPSGDASGAGSADRP
jgi:hypothetical protein